MNTFPRNARFQGHMISALPNLYVCAEDHAQLIYAGDDECEKVSCIEHSEHNGLVKIEDVLLVVNEKQANKEVELYQLVRGLDKDSPVLAILRERNAKLKSVLFGDDDV
jgi:hypothetical protein